MESSCAPEQLEYGRSPKHSGPPRLAHALVSELCSSADIRNVTRRVLLVAERHVLLDLV